MSNIKQLPHFDEVARVFASSFLDMHPSFVHGCWIALIVGGRHHSPKAWVDFLMQEKDGWGRLDLKVQHLFLSIAEASVEQLGDSHYVLQLLLPQDDEDLEERVNAISQWCMGFVRAFNESKADVISWMGDDAKEALADMEDITDVTIDITEDPQAEANYIEVVEYLRVAVSLIHQDILAGRTQSAQHSPYLH